MPAVNQPISEDATNLMGPDPSTFAVTEKTDGKKLTIELRKVNTRGDSAIVTQVMALQEAISDAESEISAIESQVNMMIYRLQQLTDDEIAMIEKSTL